MMNLDFYHVFFPQIESPTPGEIRETLQRGFEAEWSTTREGERDYCWYTDPANERYLEKTPTDEAIEGLTRRNGSITLFPANPDSDFTFKVYDSWSEYGLPELGGISLRWHRVHFRNDVETTIQEILDAATLVYESLSPPFAFSYFPLDVERETKVTREDVVNDRIPDAFYLMLLSEGVSGRIGRDQLLSAPAWKTEPLDGGGVGLVATADPMKYTPEVKGQLRSHLGLGE